MGAVAADKAKIINRLRRLEGQVRGLQRMIEEGRSCQEVLTLLAGVRSALDATGDVILEAYLTECQGEFAAGKGDVSELIAAVKLARG
jgi:CsoR family transcriptional regulator, copper-sensing transcriptional repressor